jgi:hypothetical protein
MDELADNFFCHLLGTCGGGHACLGTKNAEVRESLNPMPETATSLRRSVLASPTLFVLNENHLAPGRLTVTQHECLQVSCANCSHTLGYKGDSRPLHSDSGPLTKYFVSLLFACRETAAQRLLYLEEQR